MNDVQEEYERQKRKHMNPPKNLRTRLEEKFVQAWESLTEGWRELLSRSSGALTRFDTPAKSRKGPQEDFPRWALLAAETWETAQSVIIRVELPGMKKEDLDISIHGNQLVIRGVKRSGGKHEGRLYQLMERAYGRFERTIHLPQDIDGKRAEVSYQDGVLTVILPKTEPIPPRQLTVS